MNSGKLLHASAYVPAAQSMLSLNLKLFDKVCSSLESLMGR